MEDNKLHQVLFCLDERDNYCMDGFYMDMLDQIPLDEKWFLGDIIKHIREVYNKYPCMMMNRAFLTLQCCMSKIIETNGGNNYQLDDIEKEELENLGCLPVVMEVSQEASSWDNNWKTKYIDYKKKRKAKLRTRI
jgi:hypothetical protein